MEKSRVTHILSVGVGPSVSKQLLKISPTNATTMLTAVFKSAAAAVSFHYQIITLSLNNSLH